MDIDITSFLLGKSQGGVAPTPSLQTKSVNITTNGDSSVLPDEGYDGLAKVNINTHVVDHNWESLGYSGEPSFINDGYNYALALKNSWTPTASLTNKFKDNRNLVFMPMIQLYPSDATNVDLNYCFANCTLLKTMPLLDFGEVTNLAHTFSYCGSIESFPNFDTTKVTNTNSTFSYCINLVTAPSINTLNVIDFTSMFAGCTALENVPLYNATNAEYLTNMFSNVKRLTDVSLNNILAMCIGATSYTGTKKLSTLGLSASNYPATRVSQLSNYQDFLDAGWILS